MKQSDHFRENAANCAQLAERAEEEPTYKRMEAAALAEEKDWLDGEKSPGPVSTTTKKPPPDKDGTSSPLQRPSA